MDWDYLLMNNCMTFVNLSCDDCGNEIIAKFRRFFYWYMMCFKRMSCIWSWLMLLLLYSVVLANMLKWCDNMQSWLLDSLCVFKQLLEIGLLACIDVDYCRHWNNWNIGLCHRSGSYKNLNFYVSWTQEQYNLLKLTALDLLSLKKFPTFRRTCYLFDFVCLLVLGHLENYHSTLIDQIALEHRVAST